ncbi:transmembrane protein, putative [Medicago truncatula]|uniref:Transmembrane protein, putative n=1 Tax=Medicago truncatula TaxID=3880 RepID=A0A072VLS4_MEDTR|nr:transmembrane protein, putative [Medicago truncatula]
MAFSYNNKRILFTVLVIIFFILVVSSQLGSACRPLQDEQISKEFDGLLLQFLPRGTPSKPSTPSPIHP